MSSRVISLQRVSSIDHFRTPNIWQVGGYLTICHIAIDAGVGVAFDGSRSRGIGCAEEYFEPQW